MALDTFVHALMDGVAEDRGTGFLYLENDINGRVVTLVTINFYAKSGRTVVAAAA